MECVWANVQAELKEHHLVSVLDYVEKTEFNVFSKRAKVRVVAHSVMNSRVVRSHYE